MIHIWKKWRKQSRYREVTTICLPLVLGISATTIMEFTDRVFLANYSLNAVAAALPAGITAFLFMAFLGGVGGYAGVFIAQYTGKGDQSKVGQVLWQGIYFCIFSGVFFWLLAIFSGPTLFALIGHPPEIQVLEEQYYTILIKGGMFHVALNTLSTFFSGRGITKPVMLMYFIGMAINIPLDYALIFGKWGFPEMGISGAAIATVTAWVVPSLLLLIMIFTKKNDDRFGVLRNKAFSKILFFRLLKFGIPGSLQFTIDIFAFTAFTLIVGRLGAIPLAATTIVISINSVAFMPSMGVSQGVSILVGQALGRGDKQQAKAAVWSSAHLLLLYVIMIVFCFVTFPEKIISLFVPSDNPPVYYKELLTLTTHLLYIVSAYLILDSLYMVFTGALKGAGDNKFIMYCVAATSLIFLILPCYIGILHYGMGIYFAWFCILTFVVALFAVSAFRFQQGKWQDMLVIEQEGDK